MDLKQSRVLVTGGAGGIGGAIAAAVLESGGSVLLVDRDSGGLRDLVEGRFARFGQRVGILAADLTSTDGLETLVANALQWNGGINVLVNAAGVNHFARLQDQSERDIERALAINLRVPIQLTRRLLPHLLAQPHATILNVGSMFGHVGYPCYAVYSATKFALRGFSEALRRELAGSTVRICHLAPRATRTAINSDAVNQMNAELGVQMDPPHAVAHAALRLLQSNASEAVVGWPEKLYARLNALLPRQIDRALARQLPTILRHASGESPGGVHHDLDGRTLR